VTEVALAACAGWAFAPEPNQQSTKIEAIDRRKAIEPERCGAMEQHYVSDTLRRNENTSLVFSWNSAEF